MSKIRKVLLTIIKNAPLQAWANRRTDQFLGRENEYMQNRRIQIRNRDRGTVVDQTITRRPFGGAIYVRMMEKQARMWHPD